MIIFMTNIYLYAKNNKIFNSYIQTTIKIPHIINGKIKQTNCQAIWQNLRRSI